MKGFLLTIAIVCFNVFANAQLTTLWEKSAGSSYSWFSTTLSNTTALAYNPVTNKVLIGDRSNLIAIINVTTGTSEGTLLTTGVGTESYKWNKIRVTSDGVIYGISMVTAAGASKVYRWENQTAVPTLCATFSVTERCGDAFGLSGTGTNTVLYASGNGITSSSVNIYVLTTANGTDFSLTNTINIPITGTNAWAGRSIDPVTTGTSSDLWIRSQNTSTRRINSSGAVQFTSTDGSGANQVPSNFSNARYFTTSNGTKYLAMLGTSADATGGRKLRLLNITSESTFIDAGTSELTNTFNPNSSGIGDVAIKDNGDGTFVLFYLITNNGVMAVQTGNLMPVNFSAFTGKLLNNTVELKWTTASEINCKEFAVERSIDGTNFSAITSVASKAINGTSNSNLEYTFLDKKPLTNKSYYRLKQSDKDGKTSYSSVVSIINTKNSLSASLITNPIKDVVQLSVSSTEKKNIQIKIYNEAGSVQVARQHTLVSGENNIQINASSFTKGALFIELAAENASIEKTIIKAIKL